MHIVDYNTLIDQSSTLTEHFINPKSNISVSNKLHMCVTSILQILGNLELRNEHNSKYCQQKELWNIWYYS